MGLAFLPAPGAWRHLIVALVLGVAWGLAGATLFARPADNLQHEAAEARAEGKALAVVLTLLDCPGCREMERSVFTDPAVVRDIGRRFRTVRLDLERAEPLIDAQGRSTDAASLAKRLRAVATPSFAFFAGDGGLVYRYTGTLDQRGLRRLATYVRRGGFEQAPFNPGAGAHDPVRLLKADPPAANLPRHPDYSLAATDGRQRGPRDFQGRVVALAVGYTQCPDVCPTTLVELKAAVEALPAARRQDVQILFATLDPDRDSLSLLREYATAFSPDGGRPVLGLRGDPAATAALIGQLQLVAEKQPSATMGYTLDHSAGVFLFDRAGRLRGLAPFGQGAEALRADLARLLASPLHHPTAPRRLAGLNGGGQP